MQLEVIKNSIKPPLSKRELIMATAVAMARQRSKEWDAAHELRKRATVDRNAYIRKIASKHITGCEVSVFSGRSSGSKKSVSLTLEIDDAKLNELDDAINKIAIPQLRKVQDIRRDLERSSKDSSDRTRAILAQPGVEDALAKAGEAVLAGKAVDV